MHWFYDEFSLNFAAGGILMQSFLEAPDTECRATPLITTVVVCNLNLPKIRFVLVLQTS